VAEIICDIASAIYLGRGQVTISHHRHFAPVQAQCGAHVDPREPDSCAALGKVEQPLAKPNKDA